MLYPLNRSPEWVTFNISRAQLAASGADVREMLSNKATEEIFIWMAKNTWIADFLDLQEEVEVTSLAEHAICQCPLIDPDDESVWDTESGGAWDAAFIYSRWVELMQAKAEKSQ